MDRRPLASTAANYPFLLGLHGVPIGLFFFLTVPIWGGLGADRDALAMIPLGVALMASGLLDQRLLARSFRISEGLEPESGNVGG